MSEEASDLLGPQSLKTDNQGSAQYVTSSSEITSDSRKENKALLKKYDSNESVGSKSGKKGKRGCFSKVLTSFWFWDAIVFLLLIICNFVVLFVSISENTFRDSTVIDDILEGLYSPKIYYNNFVTNRNDDTEYLYFTNGEFLACYDFNKDDTYIIFNITSYGDELKGYFINRFETSIRNVILLEFLPSKLEYKVSDHDKDRTLYPKYAFKRDNDQGFQFIDNIHKNILNSTQTETINFDYNYQDITESHIMACYESSSADCILEFTSEEIFLLYLDPEKVIKIYDKNFEEKRNPNKIEEYGKIRDVADNDSSHLRQIRLDIMSYYEELGILTRHVQQKSAIFEALNPTREIINYIAFISHDVTGCGDMPIDVYEDLYDTFHTNTKYLKFNKAGYDYVNGSGASTDPKGRSNVKQQLNIYLQNGDWCRIREPFLKHDFYEVIGEENSDNYEGSLYCGTGFYLDEEHEGDNIDNDKYIDVFNTNDTPYLYSYQSDPNYYNTKQEPRTSFISRLFLEWRNLENTKRTIEECYLKIEKANDDKGNVVEKFVSLSCDIVFTDISGIKSVLSKDGWSHGKSTSLIHKSGLDVKYGYTNNIVTQLLNHPSVSDNTYYPILLPIYQSEAQHFFRTQDSVEAFIISDFTNVDYDSNSIVAIIRYVPDSSSMTNPDYVYKTQVIKYSEGWEFIGIIGFYKDKLLVVTTRGGMHNRRIEVISGDWSSLGYNTVDDNLVDDSVEHNFTIKPLALFDNDSSTGLNYVTNMLTQDVSLTDSYILRPILSSSSMILSISTLGPSKPIQFTGSLGNDYITNIHIFNNENDSIASNHLTSEHIFIPASPETIGYNFSRKKVQYEYENDLISLFKDKSIIRDDSNNDDNHFQLTVDEYVLASDKEHFDNIELSAHIIYPPNFNKNKEKEYPAVVMISPQTYYSISTNEYPYSIPTEHLALCIKGNAVLVYVDTCGSSLRGRVFEGQTKGSESTSVAADLIAISNWLRDKRWLNGKIGLIVSGEGGVAALKTFDNYSNNSGGKLDNAFNVIAFLSPGSDWSLFSSLNSEPKMSTPENNKPGYSKNNPNTLTRDKIGNSKILIMHGTADEIWHFQNTVVLSNALEKVGIPFEAYFYPNYEYTFSLNLPIYAKEKLVSFFLEAFREEEDP